MRRRRLPPPWFAALLLGGCVVGPNYKGPPPVAPSALSRSLAAPGVTPEPPAGRWWLELHDPLLSQLIDRALERSFTLSAARARVLEARAALARSRADFLPSTQASAIYLRTKGLTDLLGGEAAASAAAAGSPSPLAAEAGSSTLQFYDVGFDATWELDLFGATRRAQEGAKAEAQAREADLEDSKVTLSAEVARTYIQLRDRQTRAALVRRNAQLEERLVALAETRIQGGTGTELDLERLKTQLSSTQAQTGALQADVAQAMNRLAVLTGEGPGGLDPLLSDPAQPPLPPAVVAVGDPAGLLRRRPDVRAAERRLERQSALIGQRTADYFPKVELFGNLGFGATDLSALLRPGSFSYAAAPLLQWRPFDFGRTKAMVAQARFGRDEARASYQEKVLEALEDAADGVERYARERQTLRALLAVEVSADRAAALTDLRVKGGTATVSDELEAERRRIEAQSDVAGSRARLSEDFVALQKSLGLGWSAAD